MKRPTTRSAPLLFLLCATVLATWTQLASAAEVNFLVFGDWGRNNSLVERSTAQRMVSYARENNVRFDAGLLLGDNFYGKMPGGVNDLRWQVDFEQMYDPKALAMPFYAALGNHDYEWGKAEAELAYPKRHPESRWRMPARWYRVEIPADKPLVSVLVLDSNATELKGLWNEEMAWLKGELAKPRPGKWVVAIAHHPVVSNGEHGDTKELLRDWAPLFKEHKLDFFLSGHDHDLQHLEVDGWPTSFVTAGGGGAEISVTTRSDRGPFSGALNGFFHLRLTPEQAEGRLISTDGTVVHEFTRSARGEVKVVRRAGGDKN